jgi:hypothetical protein
MRLIGKEALQEGLQKDIELNINVTFFDAVIHRSHIMLLNLPGRRRCQPKKCPIIPPGPISMPGCQIARKDLYPVRWAPLRPFGTRLGF